MDEDARGFVSEMDIILTPLENDHENQVAK